MFPEFPGLIASFSVLLRAPQFYSFHIPCLACCDNFLNVCLISSLGLILNVITCVLTGYFSDDILCHFCASMISGLVTTAASMPVDIAKTRLSSSPFCLSVSNTAVRLECVWFFFFFKYVNALPCRLTPGFPSRKPHALTQISKTALLSKHHFTFSHFTALLFPEVFLQHRHLHFSHTH